MSVDKRQRERREGEAAIRRGKGKSSRTVGLRGTRGRASTAAERRANARGQVLLWHHSPSPWVSFASSTLAILVSSQAIRCHSHSPCRLYPLTHHVVGKRRVRCCSTANVRKPVWPGSARLTGGAFHGSETCGTGNRGSCSSQMVFFFCRRRNSEVSPTDNYGAWAK